MPASASARRAIASTYVQIKMLNLEACGRRTWRVRCPARVGNYTELSTPPSAPASSYRGQLRAWRLEHVPYKEGHRMASIEIGLSRSIDCHSLWMRMTTVVMQATDAFLCDILLKIFSIFKYGGEQCTEISRITQNTLRFGTNADQRRLPLRRGDIDEQLLPETLKGMSWECTRAPLADVIVRRAWSTIFDAGSSFGALRGELRSFRMYDVPQFNVLAFIRIYRGSIRAAADGARAAVYARRYQRGAELNRAEPSVVKQLFSDSAVMMSVSDEPGA
ncbi:hypothetical protein EVAR_63968_1 [Eumeta japonica]|uniref:Uncharacterized protein n=1 Tax=Eumeta variegata TaxID=151549 RepID=A0A4C1ZFK1_EUMVA|nr:hypothetical protein EVAR_63968_1 [Eumeta japonica]